MEVSFYTFTYYVWYTCSLKSLPITLRQNSTRRIFIGKTFCNMCNYLLAEILEMSLSIWHQSLEIYFWMLIMFSCCQMNKIISIVILAIFWYIIFLISRITHQFNIFNIYMVLYYFCNLHLTRKHCLSFMAYLWMIHCLGYKRWANTW